VFYLVLDTWTRKKTCTKTACQTCEFLMQV